MILKEKIQKNNCVKKLIKLHPEICSGRKNYKKFESRITKNILLTKLFMKKKDIKIFAKYKIKMVINTKTTKLIYS